MPSARLQQLGFDVPKLRFSLRTAIAACAALLVAWLFGLEHPQWSAMTVWAASQPTRGQLLEKSLFRVAGTVSGTIAGVLLVVLSGGQPPILIAGLAVWIAVCAGIGNIQRGFVSYGTILAGYSASMVALLDSSHPDHVLALGADRLATILVGVLLALVFGLLFTPKTAEGLLAGRLWRLTARVLRDVAQGLMRKDEERRAKEQHDILAEMAAIEDMLEPHGAGSRRSRRSVHAIRTLLMAEISLLLFARRQAGGSATPEIIGGLQTAATILESGASRKEALSALEQLIGPSASIPVLRDPLAVMTKAIGDYSGAGKERGQNPVSSHPVILHRDWVGARRAFIRAVGTMLAVGLFWVATGWNAGPFLLLGVSIMVSLFSTFDNPAQTMRVVFLGQVCGAFGALACRFLAWPLAANELEIVLLTMPFILAGALLFAHRRTLPAAFDYAMVSLLLLHPVYPPVGSFHEMLGGALAVVAAPLIAMIAYRLVFPLDADKRLDMLAAMMVHELQDMAATTEATKHRLVWRARLYHRLLRLTRLAERSGGSREAAIDGGLAVLATGSAILAMQEHVRAADMPAGVSRSLKAALGRLTQVSKTPDKAAAALMAAAGRLSDLGENEAETLASAARAIEANPVFFRRAN